LHAGLGISPVLMTIYISSVVTHGDVTVELRRCRLGSSDSVQSLPDPPDFLPLKIPGAMNNNDDETLGTTFFQPYSESAAKPIQCVRNWLFSSNLCGPHLVLPTLL
jgi:hypothetical protein